MDQIAVCLSSPDDPEVLCASNNEENQELLSTEQDIMWSPLLSFGSFQEECGEVVSVVERLEMLMENLGRCAWYYDKDVDGNPLRLEIE